MSTVAYPTDANASYVKSNPDVTAGIGNDGQKNELIGIACTVFMDKG